MVMLTSALARDERRRQLRLARARLEAAAVALGSCLVEGIDPDWDCTQELEAASVAYVQQLRKGKS